MAIAISPVPAPRASPVPARGWIAPLRAPADQHLLRFRSWP